MLIILLLNLLISVSSSPLEVHTDKGVVIGNKHEDYASFLGVPYSLVNSKFPFGNCLEYPNFTIPYQANREDIMCPQKRGSDYEGRLQCLTLNIYVPLSENWPCPVLVWFHGESFWNGDANEYRSTYLVRQGIIFISVNFRLGPYGFFCPKEYILPGNQGFRDQLAALKWIQKNIHAFNGDPTAVTIAGSGYGGGFVNLHLYSNFEKRLFDKAIMQSGSMFSQGFFVPPDPRYPTSIAKYWGKYVRRNTLPRDVLPFLSSKNQEDILTGALLLDRPFGICKEAKSGDNTVTQSPFFMKVHNGLRHTKLLIGYNSMEMSGLYANKTNNEFYRNSGDIIYNTLMKTFKLKKSVLKKLAVIVKRLYFGVKPYGPSSSLNLADAMSDFVINNGVERSIDRLVTAGATVYKYIFSYTGASEYRNISGAGAPKNEELKFLLNWRYNISGYEQESIRTDMVQMWADFIKFGNPTPGNRQLKWKPLHGLRRHYLNIDTTMEMMENVSQERNAFWQLLWSQYKKKALVY